MEMYISEEDKLDLPQPAPIDLTFRGWRMENSIVKSWLINYIEPHMIGNFIKFPNTKSIWDFIATTYFDGLDISQVYKLKRKITQLKQNGGTIESY